MKKPTIFAIDFGTSNSLLAAAAPGEVFEPAPIDPEAEDPTVLRSALYFGPDGGGVFGARARREFAENDFRGRLVRSIKRHLPSRAFTKTVVGGRVRALEDLIGAFLGAMRASACRHFDADVDRVVLGRPALFSNDPEEDRLAETRLEAAARVAGFREVAFCPEPVAAAYDFAEDLATPRVVLVADLGGGTSDFTLVRMGRGGFSAEDVLAVGGVAVAGDAVDGALVRRFVAPELGATARYKVPFGANVLEFPLPLVELLASPADLTLLDRERVLRQLGEIRAGLVEASDRPRLEKFVAVVEDGVGFELYDAVEAAKRELSDAEEARIALAYPGAELSVLATRGGLEDAAETPLARILGALDETLAAGGVRPEDVEIACLTGGTSRMPRVERALREKLPRAGFRRLRSFHSVVRGLARRARELAEA